MDKFLDVQEAKNRLISELAKITGFKYLKSGVLKKTVKDIVFEINFFSSKWNCYGQNVEVNADFRVVYKKFGKMPSSRCNIVAGTGYHPKEGYWYDITTEGKLSQVVNILGKRLNETAVDLANRFEENYEEAVKYLLNEKYEEYDVEIDFVADVLGQKIIKDKVKEICAGLTDEDKEEIERYRNGAKDKVWMLNRCNLKYIVDNNLDANF